MRKKIVALVGIAVLGYAIAVTAQCFNLSGCGGGANCVPLPSSVTVEVPSGSSNPNGYESSGGNCGMIWRFGLPTGTPCGGAPVSGSC